MTTEAVIVSTARTAVGKAYRGSLNNTEGPTMAGHVMAEAVKRAGIAPGEVEDLARGGFKSTTFYCHAPGGILVEVGSAQA